MKTDEIIIFEKRLLFFLLFPNCDTKRIPSVRIAVFLNSK